MTIEVVNSNGELITSFELECNPFKVGEIFSYSFKSSEENILKEYLIQEIKHYYVKEDSYDFGRRYKEKFITSIIVIES